MDENVDIEEKVKIVDHFTSQLVNSDYDHNKSKDIVISGLKGVKRKMERRKEAGKLYRSGADSLQERIEKKLLESTTWYKDREKENGEMEESPGENLNTWRKYRERKRKKGVKRLNERKRTIDKDKETYQGVIFIDYTKHSELARRIRLKLKSLEEVGQIKMKIVEKTGDKIVDLLHQSNPWSSEICGRTDCLVCNTPGEGRKGRCKQRNIT